MKAVCVLLCLALARESAGHIFRKQQYYPQMDSDNIVVDPMEYINQQYQQQQYPQQYQKTQQVAEQYPHGYKVNKQQKFKVQQQWNKQYPQYDQYSQQQELKNQQWKEIRQIIDNPSNDMQTIKESIIEILVPQNLDVVDVNMNNQEMTKPVTSNVITWHGVQIPTGPKYPIAQGDIETIFNGAYWTMNHVSEENKKIFHEAYQAAVKVNNEDVHLNATQLLTKYLYEFEKHTIKTDDGYLLTVFRIAPKQKTLENRPVIFLMHGLMGSADDWLVMGPNKSLAYLLADAGYEVWLGNARGSKYSRNHVSKHPAQADFWQFSNDEIALHDLPAMIDYALKTSDQEKLYYVGYSLGTTAFFALASTRPEYNEKVITMYALSPMAYMSHVRSPLIRMIAPISQFSLLVQDQLGHGQFQPSKELIKTAGGNMCENEIGCPNVCSNVNFVVSGINVDELDVSQIPVIMSHLSGGASTRQLKQYAQAVASHEFTKYNFGSEVNQKVYGSPLPPKYDMTKVSTPVALYYSEDDWLAHPKDVQRLTKELPNVIASYQVAVPHFGNMDFQFSKNVPEVVYKRMIESIQSQQTQSYV